MKGLIFDIKKFAVHDGPGIRTTLFLKGCPLNCVWCHNPEGISSKRQLWFFENKCIKCRTCLRICPEGALSESTDEKRPFITIDRQKCTDCGRCADSCPTNALTFDSYEQTVEEAVEVLLQDRAYYERSGGGITISGGDPLVQHEFSSRVFQAIHNEGIHTTIETSMQTKPAILKKFIGLVDLFIVDLKIMDSDKHKQYIGKDNRQILANFKLLADSGVEMLVRIPLIPGMTAYEENIREIGRFVQTNAPRVPIELINFNPLAINKYRLMGTTADYLKDMVPYKKHELEEFREMLIEEGVQVVSE